MTAIYLDLSALRLPSPDPAVPDDQLVPRALEAVAYLVDAGFDVVVIGPDDASVPGLGEGVRRETEPPEHLEPGAWYLTGEAHPAVRLPRGGATVLVGPRPPAGKVPLPRFDLEARDMAAAAMEILSRDAMTSHAPA